MISSTPMDPARPPMPRHGIRWRRIRHLLLLVILSPSLQIARGVPVATSPASSIGEPPQSQPTVVDFQPGIRIHWPRLEVEVDATVILREGAIELYACSPGIREHESIVRVETRPLFIFQALGLIGLTPGHPIRFNPDTQSLQPADGDPVEIEVCYGDGDSTRQVPIEHWMRLAGQPPDETAKAELERLPWVFAGSYIDDEIGFAADAEGTVIAVVNFGSALIALPELHTDSNAALWLVPATDHIPPPGTRCTLVLRPGPLKFTLDASGRIHRGEQSLTLADFSRCVHRYFDSSPHRRIILGIDTACPRQEERAVLRLLTSLQIPSEAITINRLDCPPAIDHDPKALIELIEQTLDADHPIGEHDQPLWTSAPHDLLDDLQARSLRLRTRTEIIIQHFSHVASDVRNLFAASRPAAD